MRTEGQQSISANEARQATTEGVGRYVLGASLALAIVAFVVGYVICFG